MAKVTADYSNKSIKEMLKALDELEPKLSAKLKRDAKKAAEPLADKIRQAIPQSSPLSGMVNDGRMGWGVKVKPNKVNISWRVARSRTKHTTGLVTVQVMSPATAITDYAGRKGQSSPRRSETKPYTRNGKTRTHKVTTQGRAMINTLNRTRRASRWAWYAAEKALPATNKAVKSIIEEYAKKVNRELK